MAKKKLEVFEKASQNFYIVGEVKATEKEEKTSETTGTTWTEYKSRIKTPEGVTIFVKQKKFTPKEGQEISQFLVDAYDYLDELCKKDFNKEREFVYIKGVKKDDKPMFNWITNYENDEGKISYNVSGFINKINFVIDEEENVVLNFQNGASKFLDREIVFKARMYVNDINENTLLLTDGKEEYANTLVVELSEGMENKAQIGQGYDFRLKLKKGKKIKIDSGTANWGDGDTADYEPDKLIVDAVEGIVKDMTLGKIVKSKKSTTTTTKKEDLDDLPF